MKYVIVGVIFLGIPFWLLNNLVFPELEQLKTFYSNVDVIAEKAATGQAN